MPVASRGTEVWIYCRIPQLEHAVELAPTSSRTLLREGATVPRSGSRPGAARTLTLFPPVYTGFSRARRRDAGLGRRGLFSYCWRSSHRRCTARRDDGRQARRRGVAGVRQGLRVRPIRAFRAWTRTAALRRVLTARSLAAHITAYSAVRASGINQQPRADSLIVRIPRRSYKPRVLVASRRPDGAWLLC